MENIDIFEAVFGNILLTLLRIYNGIFVIFLKEWGRIYTFSWLLHCEEPAFSGGENYLLDHELAIREYILKHDNLDSLSRSDTFIIPGNNDAGRDATEGYVCDINSKYKKFHMKFSMRERNIELNEQSKIAFMRMKKIIKEDCKKYYITYKLSKNEGIVSNNILHGRNSFVDGKVMRKLYRIRSYERI